MYFNIILSVVFFLPIIIAIDPPDIKPCPFNVFEQADNPALLLEKTEELKSKVLECFQDIRGNTSVTIQDASCDELMCAYECTTDIFQFVSIT